MFPKNVISLVSREMQGRFLVKNLVMELPTIHLLNNIQDEEQIER